MGKVKIKKSQLKNIIREVILESLDEGTNMKTLYHFTDMKGVRSIFACGYLKLSHYQKDYRSGKNYMSLTRHKSRLEGYGSVEHLPVRIELDMDRMNSEHGIKTEPFEYYSPSRGGTRMAHVLDAPKNSSGKSLYGVASKNGAFSAYGDQEYMNQAEEHVISDKTTVGIEAVTRVDILCKDEWSCTRDNVETFEYELSKFKTFPLNLVFIYTTDRDFNLQTNNCVTIDKFVNNTPEYRQVMENFDK